MIIQTQCKSMYGESLWDSSEAVVVKGSMRRPGIGVDSWVLLVYI